MIHNLAGQLATYCVEHELVDAKLFPFCRYKFETTLGTALFYFFLLILAVLSKAYVEIFIFTITATIFRKRMGGWHAPYPWLCQIMSTALVIIAVFILGPLLKQIPSFVILLFSIIVDLLSYIVSPSYPTQLHFTLKEVQANTMRKDILVIILLFIHLISYFFDLTNMLLYTFLGLTTTLSTVLLEKFKKKGKVTST